MDLNVSSMGGGSYDPKNVYLAYIILQYKHYNIILYNYINCILYVKKNHSIIR